MKVEPISNGSLRIWLSEEEMNGQDIGAQLRSVLQTAQKQLTRLGKHLLVEQIPVAGGCVVLISARRSPIGKTTVYGIKQVGTLLRLAEQWAGVSLDEPAVRTCLYEIEGGYALVVYPVSKLSRRQTTLLREYGTLIGRGDAAVAYIAERGRLLAAGDALGRLSLT